ncbi:endonuclease/exonuclease/phosphatase family protein [uncultured Kocuria sp.]|uniref:endonuclease/exonuclease/phosphatase family protein n=1 Tax=uncultured Kocuria sp. TaxID=259305 RepID=UPI00261D1217|nr:endonuclease/exonuclease/phosphatase family protein [uncultured Kocuria sp.]
MTRVHRPMTAAALAAVLLMGAGAPAVAGPDHDHGHRHGEQRGKGTREAVRFMTYNASLNRGTEGQLREDLATADDAQAQAVAEVIQRTDPEILLINEFDHDPEGRSAELFHDNYLAVSQNGQNPVDYPYVYSAPVNTGVPSGLDLNQDGTVGGPDDAWGFGAFPGQYGMVVYSKHPIDTPNIRTFQGFRWADMPDNLLPADYYTDEQAGQLRLSSKSHWDVPVRIGKKTVHVLASHPTPPSFDGDENRNGRRNHDEIRFWADYVSDRAASSYIYDDEGRRGGLEPGSRFVVMGDQNSDPHDGDSWPGAIQQLLEHPRVQDPLPTSAGGPEAAARQGGVNLSHLSDPAYDTADFNDDPAPGNLRADYVLPSKNLRVLEAGVWWPAPGEPGSELTGEYPFPTSDHRPVYIDIAVAGHR